MRTKTIISKLLFGSTLALAALMVSCSKNSNNDLDLYNLQGKVKYLKENMYLAEGIPGKVTKGAAYRPNGMWDVEQSFNKDGNLTEERQWEPGGSNIGKTEYAYRKDNPQLKDCCVEYDADNDPYQKKDWIYATDKKGKTTSTLTHHVILDIMGNVLSSDSIAFDEHSKIRTTLSFDKDAQLVQKSTELMDGEYPIRTEVFEGNKVVNCNTSTYSNGLRDSVVFYNPADGATPVATIGFRYDKYGNIIEQHGNDENGEPYLTETFEYTYDKKGNWTKCIHYLGGHAVTIQERKIEYY